MSTMTKPTLDPEFAALIPPLTADELAELEASLLRDGCLAPLITWRGLLVDGHHRLRLCETHGVRYDTTEIDVPDRESALVWAIRHQLARRNLTPYARAELALKIEPLIAVRSRRGFRSDFSPMLAKGHSPLDAREEVARSAGLSHGTYSKAKMIAAGGSEQVKDRLRRGETTINAAYRHLASARTIDPVPIPAGTFRTIEADPPWQLDAAEWNTAVAHYPTMDLEAIKALREEVLARAADGCHLYLWAITPMLPEAFEVMGVWGFTYKTLITWVKPSIGTGHYYRGATEHVLFGVRGTLPCLRADQPNWFEAPRGRHSEKPSRFYEIVEGMSPGPRIRLFARGERDGWASWVNEAAGESAA